MSDKIDLSEPITLIAGRLGIDKKNIKRITLEPGRAVITAFDLNQNGAKYVQIPPSGSSNCAATYERTFEIVS